jgi:hypothetical protein
MSEYPPDDRVGSAWFGLPSMLAVTVVIAAATTSDGLIGLLYAVIGVLVLFLAIGLAMTIAKRS